jgi:hypothetical protein
MKRFTSFRFACPGLNSAAGYAGSLSLILLSFTMACGAKEPAKTPGALTKSSPATAESYPNLAAQAKEVNDAFGRKDFARVVDLTYPKLVENLGGREKMLSEVASQLKEMEAEGVTIISSTAGAPTQIVQANGSVYAVVPTILKVKARDGMFQTEGSMIAISPDNGQHWTFIDAGGKDRSLLKSLIPDAADKLNLPAEKKPVKLS